MKPKFANGRTNERTNERTNNSKRNFLEILKIKISCRSEERRWQEIRNWKRGEGKKWKTGEQRAKDRFICSFNKKITGELITWRRPITNKTFFFFLPRRFVTRSASRNCLLNYVGNQFPYFFFFSSPFSSHFSLSSFLLPSLRSLFAQENCNERLEKADLRKITSTDGFFYSIRVVIASPPSSSSNIKMGNVKRFYFSLYKEKINFSVKICLKKN